MVEEGITEEQKKMASDLLAKSGNASLLQSPMPAQQDSDFLVLARQLKNEQETLFNERTKFEADKKEFAQLMKDMAQRGRALAGGREPTDAEKIDSEAKTFMDKVGWFGHKKK